MKTCFRYLMFLTAMSIAATPVFADGPGTGDPPPPPPAGGTSTSSSSKSTTSSTAQTILTLLELLGL
jgi:hypothetical protein